MLGFMRPSCFPKPVFIIIQSLSLKAAPKICSRRHIQIEYLFLVNKIGL